MSIADDEQRLPSVTEGDRALELFTDRYSLSRLFVERMNGEFAPQEILFFHGPGGNGKSLLLKYLRQNLCKGLRADQWQGLQGLSDDQVVEAIAGLPEAERLPVPAALLDFGLVAQDEVRPRDRFYGLLMLRKALGESAQNIAPGWKLKFPRYDFACIWYLHSKGKSTEEIKALFPLGDAAGLVTTISDAISQNPAGALINSVLSLFADDLGQQFAVYLSRLGLKKKDFQRIQGLDIDRELVEELPQFLAGDLNAAMAQATSPKRVALFFDTHESFWGGERNQPKESYFFQDEWLRRLLRNLELKQGIVAVVAGRDVPRWAEAKVVKPETDIPEKYLCCVAVENLAAADARAFLNKVGIEDEALANSLVAYASLEEGAVHPLHLGLCADVVLEAEHGGNSLEAIDFAEVPVAFKEKSAQLIERLLRYVDADMLFAIHALSACRTFDFCIYKLLGENLEFAADRPTFDRLIRFSFVWKTEQSGTDWYRIHDLIRRLDNEPLVKQSHKVLADYYKAKKSIEFIYHINRLDPSKGISAWISGFDNEIELSNYETCNSLLEIQKDLTVEKHFDFGKIHYFRGRYFHFIGLYKEANKELNEALLSVEKEIDKSPKNQDIYNAKGLILKSLGDLQESISKYHESQEHYQLAKEVYDRFILISPDKNLLLNQANLLRKMAELYTKQSKYKSAITTFNASISYCDRVLDSSPNLVDGLQSKGNSLQGLGDLQALLCEETLAQENYLKSISMYESASQNKPRNPHTILLNKGNSFQALGDLLFPSQPELSREYCMSSIYAYDDALTYSENNSVVLFNKGLTLSALGRLYAASNDCLDAEKYYKKSICLFNKILEIAPHDVELLNNKGYSMSKLGDLQAGLGEYDSALNSYTGSIDTYNDALALSPNSIYSLTNKGYSLQHLAVLEQNFSISMSSLNHSCLALNHHIESIECFDLALNFSPDFPTIWEHKGEAYYEWIIVCLRNQMSLHLITQFCKKMTSCWIRCLELAPQRAKAEAEAKIHQVEEILESMELKNEDRKFDDSIVLLKTFCMHNKQRE